LVPPLADCIAIKLRRQRPRCADLFAIEESLIRLLDALEDELQILALPALRHLDEAAIPSEAFVLGDLGVLGILPRQWHFEYSPSLGARLRRRHEDGSHAQAKKNEREAETCF